MNTVILRCEPVVGVEIAFAGRLLELKGAAVELVSLETSHFALLHIHLHRCKDRSWQVMTVPSIRPL
jgi:hypothetical protein